MKESKENCPFAYRQYGDPNVHCWKVQAQAHVRWSYCPKQYKCQKTDRWEAPLEPVCKYRKEEAQNV